MPIILFSLPVLLLSFITRAGLLGYALFQQQFTATTWSIVQIFALGLFNDVVTLAYLAAPFAVMILITPSWLKRQRFFHLFSATLYFGWIFLLLFSAVGEYFFWEEFESRYNFIAVDYLVYTREVADNITESYPVFSIIALLLLLSAGIFAVFLPNLKALREKASAFRTNLIQALLLIGVSCVPFFAVNSATTDMADNRYASELNKNGIYTLFAAFRNNQLDYKNFYKTIAMDDAAKRLRGLVKAGNETYVSDDIYDLSRVVNPTGKRKNYNVILLSVESLSAEFLGQFGSDKTITPVLNKLGPEGLVFTRYFATGTRTVRGLEAMSLSVPPTPGNSILRRPGNEGLFSIGEVFKEQGYDSKFIYGGYGYFDNMNYFFSHNGFTVIDRSDMKEVSFANAWGVADEDLFAQALKEADSSYAAKRPFFSLVMTTSNHRPYTYPAGKIDIPSGTGRKGAVKYTDFAIGRFLEQAKTKPWFNNTLFVITADHCASSAGKAEIPVQKYHIPLIIYAPKLITPGVVDNLTSQIDLAPTILGLLNMRYTSKFFGSDALYKSKERAVLGTYQKLGYITPSNLVVLDTGRKTRMFTRGKDEELSAIPLQEEQMKDAISYYQVADYMFSHGLMRK